MKSLLTYGLLILSSFGTTPVLFGQSNHQVSIVQDGKNYVLESGKTFKLKPKKFFLHLETDPGSKQGLMVHVLDSIIYHKRLQAGESIDDLLCFQPGTGMAISFDNEDKAAVLTEQAHHNWVYFSQEEHCFEKCKMENGRLILDREVGYFRKYNGTIFEKIPFKDFKGKSVYFIMQYQKKVDGQWQSEADYYFVVEF